MRRYLAPSVRRKQRAININLARSMPGASEEDLDAAFEAIASDDPELRGFPLKRSYIYDLVGVSLHGGTLTGGHYTAYGRNILTGQWTLFDDTNTFPVGMDRVQDNKYVAALCCVADLDDGIMVTRMLL